ncbi:MAG: pirin family protein [Dehalococcoidia bacterium]|nr:pirin family protein [Dehalococcoidia bacterium]
MLQVRKADTIHREQGGWFDARWHFSFDHYRDPEQMGVGPLRVFNDDRLEPAAVWPMHPHADVEGITYVVEGHFGHADSIGGGGVLEPGGVQRMSLGSGARHSEQNAAWDEPLRFIQFWLLPDTPSLEPELEQRQFTRDDFRGGLRQVLGPGEGDYVKVHQDGTAWVAVLEAGESATHALPAGRGAYLYVLDGQAALGEEALAAGDAVKAEGPETLTVTAVEGAHLLLVDVPLEFERVGVWSR